MLPLQGKYEPGKGSNEGVLPIPQSFSITGDSPSDCLYLGHSLRESYSSAEMQSVDSTAQAYGVKKIFVLFLRMKMRKF